LKKLNKTVKKATGQVSALTRSLALGYLAVAWALLTASEDPLKSMAANVNRYLVLALAACSVLFLTCDLLQYFAIARSATEAASRAKDLSPAEADVNEKSLAFRAQGVMFFLKFWVAVLGGVLLVVIFICLMRPIGASQVPTPAKGNPTNAIVPKTPERELHEGVQPNN